MNISLYNKRNEKKNEKQLKIYFKIFNYDYIGF